jgi:hypothetical protein
MLAGVEASDAWELRIHWTYANAWSLRWLAA